MNRTIVLTTGALAALSLVGLPSANVAWAANFGDWMNPSKWFGGNRDRDYYGGDYYGPGYGYGGPGYGYGAPG